MWYKDFAEWLWLKQIWDNRFKILIGLLTICLAHNFELNCCRLFYKYLYYVDVDSCNCIRILRE